MTSCGCGCCAGTEVETPVPVTNPSGLPAITYRAGDYGGFLSSMRARLSSPAYPALSAFTVRDTGDPAVALLDGWAVVADILTFYTERLANEGYLRTATQDQSLRLLGRLVGYAQRPGVAADTYLSYTLDKDPSGQDTTVTISSGTRAQSIPAPGQDPQSFESSDDLLARWSWNDLQVRMRQPVQITSAGLSGLSQVSLSGTGTGLKPGNRLLFVFGDAPGSQALFVASQVAVDQTANVTVVGQALPPSGSMVQAHSEVIHEDGRKVTDPALTALATVIGTLRVPPSRTPASSAALVRDPAKLYAPGSDTGPKLLAALDPRISGLLYAAWGQADITQPQATQEVQALRVTASPFGAIAPLQPQFDSHGHPTTGVEWPLAGFQDLSFLVTYDAAGTPVLATLNLSSVASVDVELTAGHASFDQDVGPGHVHITVQTAPTVVTLVFTGGIPNRTVIITSPTSATSPLDVTVQNGGDPLTLSFSLGTTHTGTQGGLKVTATWGAGELTSGVSVDLLAAPDPRVLALDAVYDGIAPGMWVAIERPRKGQAGSGGIPGDSSLALVVTTVKTARVISRADYGITGKVTSLTLADPWLDEKDTMLADIRDATVYTGGVPLQLATEPVTDDISGDTIELAQAYDGLTPGQRIVVAGERTDIPATTGVPGAELSMIAAVAQTVDPSQPGDTVHTVITLAAQLAYTYRRATVHVYANVVHATQGATRDEVIGSGDASQAGQTFALFQSPLTWLAAANPLGAASTLEVRADGVLWQEVDSFADSGPGDRVYVTSVGDGGRVRVTFGDGVHGARLPTGQENVRAHYRVGLGSAGNVAAGQVSQLTTRPLGVSGVNNPLPAVGGADPDDAAQARRGIPLSLTALDRLVGVTDYENFARARAGIGRASAQRLYDGMREVVHVTVAGVGDIPLTSDSDIVVDLQAALVAYGDPQLPVAVAVRQAILLVVAASVRVDALHTWDLVEPQVRAALTGRLGFSARELGQPAYLSEVIATVQAVPGVDYVDVTTFAGVPDSETPAELQDLAAALTAPADVIPALPARFDETRYTVTAHDTVTSVAAANGITVAQLLILNPDLTATTPLEPGRSVVVFRGIRPAQLVMLTPDVAETLILTEAPS
jgi:predicted phage baseplate assembly protein